MQNQPNQTVIVQVAPTNGLGTAGFVISLISFFLCGLTSPLGLIVSLVALLFRPRGMAAAGVLLGLLGSWWLFAGGLAIVAMVGGAIGLASVPPPSTASISPPPRVANEPVASADSQPAETQVSELQESATTDAPELEVAEQQSSSTESPTEPAESATPTEPSTSTDEDMSLAAILAEERANLAKVAKAKEAERLTKFRTWTSADGKFSVEAEFVYVVRDKVRLRKLDGTTIDVPLEKLSESDRAWIDLR